LEPGSPFGRIGISSLILHLHIPSSTFHRLRRRNLGRRRPGGQLPAPVTPDGDAVLGLTISEGAIANILVRAEAPLLAATAPIAAAARASPVVGSDETSAQVRGKTWWQGGTAEHKRNLPRHRRYPGASFVTTFLDGAQPEICVADRCGGQLGPRSRIHGPLVPWSTTG
jgi:hypothetical protein